MSMKKIWLSLAAIGSTALLVTGASFALFTATSSTAEQSIKSGTVRLDGGGAFSCTGTGNHTPYVINNIAPGDKGSYDCKVEYIGSLDAWIGLTTETTSPDNDDAGAGAPGLLSCDLTPNASYASGNQSLQLSITGSKIDPTGAVVAPPNPYLLTGANQVVGKALGGVPHETLHFIINWELPIEAGNGCQNRTAEVTMVVKAVQAKNNTNPGNTGPNAWN